MTSWNQNNVRKQMTVYTADKEEIGHIAEIYEDSFEVHKGAVLPTHRYIPYSAIATVADNQVHLSMSAEEATSMKWEKRPDYEHHLGDPTQLFYDRGHGVADPFDETNPDRT